MWLSLSVSHHQEQKCKAHTHIDSHCGILPWALFIKRNLKMYILVISKYGLGERASSLINRKVVFGNKRPCYIQMEKKSLNSR